MAQARPRLHAVLILHEVGRPDRLVVWDTQEITLGRSPENDISLDQAEISRNHAVFVRGETGFEVHNKSTSNGTLVNGELIRTHALQNKDEIQVGELRVQFLLTENPAGHGLRVAYASQLKAGFEQLGAAQPNAEATMLGLVDVATGDDNEESFRVQPAREFEYDLCDIDRPAAGQLATRDLDVELDGFGLDGLDAVPPPKPEAESWTLEDDPAGTAPRAAKPAAPAAAPPARRPAAPAGKSAQKAGSDGDTVSLRLDVRGLPPALRRALAALDGRPLELPPLAIRLRVDPDE